MSISAYATAVRDYLRGNLSDFYGSDVGVDSDHDTTDQEAVRVLRNRNCKIMLDDHPTADCGKDLISLSGSYHQPQNKNLMMALDEEFGLTVAVSRKIALIPPDYRGELGYINAKSLTIDNNDEEDRWLTAWKSTEARCREIVALLQGSYRYRIMVNANTIIVADKGGPFTEPLLWTGTDPAPKQVGPEFFFGYQDPQPDSDNVFGLVQKVYFGNAIRMQRIDDLDRVPT